MGHPHHDHEGDKVISHHDQHGHAPGARDIGDSFSRDTSGLPQRFHRFGALGEEGARSFRQ